MYHSKVWVAIVDLLSCLEAGEQVDKYTGLVEKLAEAVSFGAQARGDNLDVMPLQLAREVKAGKKGQEEDIMPSLRNVGSFLEEAKEKRREIGESQEDDGETQTSNPNPEGLGEAFTRMSKEMEAFNIKYQVQRNLTIDDNSPGIVQGELLPWLPVSQTQPKDRPEMVKALQVETQSQYHIQLQ